MAIKNYLKSVKDITAPLTWKSSPKSPKTQLAYVTQPEIDMLVKANMHGSMKGKPNKGPMGIISLDGGGVEYTTKGPAGQDKPVSFGDRAGVTIDVSTKEGQDKKQEFRDKTGSNVVTEAEKKGREALGREAADTSAPPGGTDTSTTVVDDTGTDIKDSKAKKPADLLKILQEKGKAGLTEKQLVRIVNLLAANKRNENVLNPDEESVFGKLFGGGDAFKSDYALNLEKMIKDYREGYPNYFADKSPGALGGVMGFADSLTAGDYRGDKVAEEQGFGSDTLQGLKKKLSASDKAWLKINRPELYYGGKTDVTTMPGLGGSSMDEMQDLASLPISGPGAVTDPELIRRIVEAREVTRDRDGSGGQSGIMTTVPPVVPDPDDPMIPVDPDPYFPVDPTLPVPPKYPSSVITDYTQLGLPNIYGNQQIPTYDYANFNQTGQPVGLQDYLENLRQRFGIG